MGGTLQVSSQVGQGSTFTLDLSLPVSTEPFVEPSQPNTAWQRERLQMHRVLCVAGHEATRQSLQLRAYDWGMPMDVASDGESGTLLLQRHAYDVVLVARELPDMSGLQFAQLVARLRADREIPVTLLLKNVTDRETNEQLAQLGIGGALSKAGARTPAVGCAVSPGAALRGQRNVHADGLGARR